MNACLKVRLVRHRTNVDGPSNSSWTVYRGACAPLNLNVLNSALDIEKIDPEDIEFLRIILWYSVDSYS